MSDFSQAFDSVFGTYAPIIVEVGDGTNVAMTDWGYVGKVALLLVGMYCVLRLLGGLIRGRD